MGAPASARGDPAAAAALWLRAHAPKFARWLALLFVASLFVPALTKQWNDRKQELQIKEELATSISTIVSDAIYTAEAAQAERAAADRQSARHDVIHEWLRERATVEPRLRVYFGDSEAAEWWFRTKRIGYRNAVLVFAHLACCDDAQRAKHVQTLQSFVGAGAVLPRGGDPWRTLACEPRERCGGIDYGAAYRWLGNQLLYQRALFLQDLLKANGSGFSTGWRDFVHDLFPLR